MESPGNHFSHSDRMDVETQFWKLVDEANRLDEEAHRILEKDDNASVDSNRMVEPAYAAIVRLAKQHPDSYDVLVRCFSEIVLWKRSAPWMLVPFCMRALRMPEIRELIDRDSKEHSGTAYYANHMNHWDAIVHAYDDEVWQDAIAFDYFAHEHDEVQP